MLVLFALAACSGGDTDSRVAVPGAEESARTTALEAGAALLQGMEPLRQLDAYLDGFHFASGDLSAQMEAHHYCGHLNEDVIQCVLFDGNQGNAKLVGVEYIVSASTFTQLPDEEKHLWHSHAFEVRSGQLIAPGIPAAAEHALMEKLAGTYGKTWHTWHTDEGASLPLGIPMLMMGFTQPGQADESRVRDRDLRFDVSSSDKRAQRADIREPIIDSDADAWQKGIAPRLRLEIGTPKPPGATR